MIVKKRIKDLFFLKAGGDLDGMLVENEYTKNTPYPIYANSAINDGIYGYTTHYRYKNSAITVTARGNLGFAFYRTKPFNAIGRLLILFPKYKNINLNYINYILQNNRTIGNQTAIPQLTAPEFGNQIISLFEDYKIQSKIANYLDIETTRIDRKISILEQKFKKLEEYKQSVIFETVTKGLDNNAPMKNSGIEWIGDIPKHWEVRRLKDIANIKKGEVFDEKTSSSNGLYPYINGGISPSDWSNYYNALENTIAVSEGGASAGYTQFMKTKYWAGSHCYKISSINNIRYVYYLLKGFEKALMMEKTGSAMPNLQKTRFINFTVSFVNDKVEQERIVDFLDFEISRIDKQKTIIKKKIELLKEYKQTVIYEAVTGKMEI